jgi:hypothetical protein
MLMLLEWFRKAPRRQFVLLDAERRCLMMLCTGHCPQNGNWVEVGEFCLSWLGKPLPPGAALQTQVLVPTRWRWLLAG